MLLAHWRGGVEHRTGRVPCWLGAAESEVPRDLLLHNVRRAHYVFPAYARPYVALLGAPCAIRVGVAWDSEQGSATRGSRGQASRSSCSPVSSSGNHSGVGTMRLQRRSSSQGVRANGIALGARPKVEVLAPTRLSLGSRVSRVSPADSAVPGY